MATEQFHLQPRLAASAAHKLPCQLNLLDKSLNARRLEQMNDNLHKCTKWVDQVQAGIVKMWQDASDIEV